MARALSALGPADREVLLLTLVEGLKPGEIAVKTGLSPDVVRTRKSRALRRILELIEGQSQNPAIGHL
jgi:DNA-directed RNA polymerase specialized sigma24 family protein